MVTYYLLRADNGGMFPIFHREVDFSIHTISQRLFLLLHNPRRTCICTCLMALKRDL